LGRVGIIARLQHADHPIIGEHGLQGLVSAPQGFKDFGVGRANGQLQPVIGLDQGFQRLGMNAVRDRACVLAVKVMGGRLQP